MTARFATAFFATILLFGSSMFVGCSMDGKSSDESAAAILGESSNTPPVSTASFTDEGSKEGADEKETDESYEDKSEEGKVADVRIVIKTDKGDINAVIYATKTPVTAANFLNLASRKFYNGLMFHRVIPDFMIQGGDPQGTGGGGPGYKFQDETLRELKHDRPGILSMANSDDRYKPAYSNSGRTNGSQFFITHVPTPHLDGKHTVFGSVESDSDQAVVDAIRGRDKILAVIIKDKNAAAALLKDQEKQVAEWNKVLDRK